LKEKPPSGGTSFHFPLDPLSYPLSKKKVCTVRVDIIFRQVDHSLVAIGQDGQLDEDDATGLADFLYFHQNYSVVFAKNLPIFSKEK
jgi:hypothetical protein